MSYIFTIILINYLLRIKLLILATKLLILIVINPKFFSIHNSRRV